MSGKRLISWLVGGAKGKKAPDREPSSGDLSTRSAATSSSDTEALEDVAASIAESGSGRNSQMGSGSGASSGFRGMISHLSNKFTYVTSINSVEKVDFPLGDLPAFAQAAARHIILCMQPGVAYDLKEGARLLAALECSCKGWRDVCQDPLVWTTFIKNSFGPDVVIEDEAEAKQLFYSLHTAKVSVTTFSITWLNDNYLTVVERPGAMDNRAIELKSVCWLDLEGGIPDIPIGSYTIIWRLAFDRVHLGRNDVSFTTWVSHGEEEDNRQWVHTVPGQKWSEIESEVGSNVWTAVEVGVVRVEKRGTVKVKMWAHDNHWKSGMLWDTVCLKPVSQQAVKRRRAQPFVLKYQAD